jgi:hypothetical protein
MLDKFRELSDKGKMVVIGVMLALFVGLIILVGLFVKGKETTPAPDTTPLPYATVTATPTATPTPTATSTPTPGIVKPGSDIVYGQTSLSVEDQQAAQAIARDGLLNYFKTVKAESPQAKLDRLKAYFTPESEVFNGNSPEAFFGMDAPTEDNYIISAGTVDYIDPVGGDAKIYKVVTGLTYKVQFNRAGQAPQILEKNGVFTTLLSKESGAWKITSFTSSAN